MPDTPALNKHDSRDRSVVECCYRLYGPALTFVLMGLLAIGFMTVFSITLESLVLGYRFFFLK